MRYVIVASRQATDAAMVLKRALINKGKQAFLIKWEGSEYQQRDDDVIIHFGGMNPHPRVHYEEITYRVNGPRGVKRSTNKILCFKTLTEAGIETVPWTKDYEVAKAWLEDGHKVVCRTKVEGKDGEGTTIIDSIQDIPEDTKLFTRYWNKTHEFRVHRMLDINYHISLKRRRFPEKQETANPHEMQTSGNGYVFGLFRPEDFKDDLTGRLVAKASYALKALRLHAGAVDMLYNEETDEIVVCETNTAPCLYDVVAEKYAEAITSMFG